MVKYDGNEILLWAQARLEYTTQDHRGGTWRHEGMKAFPPDWPQFLSKICEIVSVDVRRIEGGVKTKESEYVAKP